MAKYRVILSGGGTGGHIYPAVSVAQALQAKLGNNVEILFVGAEGKMEMEKVPALGYNIEGLPVAGIQRRLALSNFALPAKIFKSLRKAKKILKKFNADIAVGFGGYASGPILWSAQRMGIPTILQEQNSYAGLTNKLLAKKARHICVAYSNMERFFPQERIIITGNPLRGSFTSDAGNKAEALEYFGLKSEKPVVLIVGGSLGTRTLNEVMKRWADDLISDGSIQFIWQNGKFYDTEMENFMSSRPNDIIWRGAFIDRMDYAYAAADVVISRSGACSVSELCLVGKPVIFVPSPNVAEDHQTKNALALSSKNAALLVKDNEAAEKVIPIAKQLLADKAQMAELSTNILSMAYPDSADKVAQQIIDTIDKNRR